MLRHLAFAKARRSWGPSACPRRLLGASAGCTGSAGYAPTPSHSRRAGARSLLWAADKCGGLKLPARELGARPSPGRVATLPGTRRIRRVHFPRGTIHTVGIQRRGYTEDLAGLTHDSGAATSTAPARHTRHARRVTPQDGYHTRRPLPSSGTLVPVNAEESHLWLPRHMELPHAYIARTTWGAVGLSREERERHVYIVGQIGLGKEHDAV